MADISKCLGIGCKRSNDCYRVSVASNEFRQSYFSPMNALGECDYFISTIPTIKYKEMDITPCP